jgi:hypothetical protein
LIVPDPLYIEIATDLQKKCSTAFPLVHADLILAAKEALASRQDERRRLAVRDALLHFVEVLVDWAAFEIGKGPSLKVLLRGKGLRKGIRENSIQDIERGTAFSHAAVDRAFYKSSNLIALQACTPEILH